MLFEPLINELRGLLSGTCILEPYVESRDIVYIRPILQKPDHQFDRLGYIKLVGDIITIKNFWTIHQIDIHITDPNCLTIIKDTIVSIIPVNYVT